VRQNYNLFLKQPARTVGTGGVQNDGGTLKKTKIIATLGPASETPEMIENLIKSGANVFRLNFSHGDHNEHGNRITLIREISARLGVKTAILADLQGPKIRIGEYDGFLHKNETVTLDCDKANTSEVPVQYQDLYKDVKPGDQLLLDDGLLEVKVKEIKGKKIIATVVIGGKLTAKKGINLPTGSITADVLTEKDKVDAKYALSRGVDFLALSFVREATDIENLRKIIKKSENPDTAIIAKIERHEAVSNFDEIMDASDAVMVARGDMGIELSPQKVPLIQKQIVKKCLAAGKPVIVATQMLDSMIRNPRSTRAETSDIANAILDGTDAIMLSGETANGKYPKEAVKVMNRIAIDTENWVASQGFHIASSVKRVGNSSTEAIAKASVQLTEQVGCKFIVAATASGSTARTIAKYRPNQKIVAVTENARVAGRLCLSWGITPHVFSFETNTEMMKKLGKKLVEVKHAKIGDNLTVVSGRTKGKVGGTNIIRIYIVE
jgi:pyruvate kinase